MFNLKIRKDFIIFALIFLYPFLPVNYYLGLLSYANVCAVLIVFVYIIFYQHRKVINIFNYIPWFWIYIIVYSLFSFVTRNPLAGIATFISEFLVSVCIITIIRDEKTLYRILDGIILSAVILGILGVIEALTKQYIFQSALFEIESSIRYGVLRCAVTFGHPINFGLYQAIAAILCFYRMNQKERTSEKTKYKFAYLIIIISMILSVSRLAICLFVSVQMILLLRQGVTKAFKYICVTALIISIMIGIMDIMGLQVLTLFSDMMEMILGQILGFKTTVNTDSIGMGNRFDLYSWVANSMKGHEVLGMGVGAAFKHKMTDWFTKTSIEVSYLNIYYQCGIVGVTVLILSYINVIKFLFNKKNRKIQLPTETNLTFENVLLITIIMYYICLFGVQETDLSRLYCLLISLGIAYVRIGLKKCLN